MSKRKKYEPKDKLHTSAAMAKMRDIAFGQKTRSHIFDVTDRMEKLRDDDAMIQASKDKQARKNAKRAANK